MAEERLTKEEFESKYVPMLNQIGELVITAENLPEDADQSELLSAINLVKQEMSATFDDRVAEISQLRQENEALKRQRAKLQQTNQDLFLKLGSQPSAPPPTETAPPKKSWSEIGRIIDNL